MVWPAHAARAFLERGIGMHRTSRTCAGQTVCCTICFPVSNHILTLTPPIGYVARYGIVTSDNERAMLSEYRQRFGELHTELHREDYLFRSGWKPRRETGAILREYSDLFEKADELRRAHEETSAHRATERASIRRLIAFAQEGHITSQVREFTDEIEQYELRARLDWNERKLTISQANDQLAVETDVARRRDLFARCADLIRGATDLRAERLERMQDAPRALGFDSLPAMRSELRSLNVEKLMETSGDLLSKTESRYVSSLASLLSREIGVSLDDATEADLPLLLQFTRFDHFFSRERMPGIYRDLFAELGFQTDNQSNVELDSASRPHKQAQAFCAPIRVPDEIKLVFTACGGQANYREFLREAGYAQHAAWTSRNLYPEFRVGPFFTSDRTVQQAWGMLLENLLLDPHWLMSTFGFVENAAFRHTLAIFQLIAARNAAASLIYESEFYAGKLAGNAGARFAELMTDAARLRFDETNHLQVLDEPFHAADFLRACAFESQMREYLKTKFGEHWWATRKAGEMLIDLWNTGQQYSIEELAAMIGLGELDFDWLIAELQTQVEA